VLLISLLLALIIILRKWIKLDAVELCPLCTVRCVLYRMTSKDVRIDEAGPPVKAVSFLVYASTIRYDTVDLRALNS